MATREGKNGGVLKIIEPGSKGHENAGRPKGSLNVKTVLRKWLSIEQEVKNPFTDDMEMMTPLDMMVVAQIAKACKGDTAAFDKILDRLDGKVVQSVSVSDDDGSTIFEIVYGKKGEDDTYNTGTGDVQ